MQIDWLTAAGAAAAVPATVANFSATTTYTKYTVTGTSGSDVAQAKVSVRNQGAAANTFFCDGAQFEQKVIPTPYVETNGATAARSAARVQLPAGLLSAGEGWIAARIRPGWSTGGEPFAFVPIFEWANDNSNFYMIAYNRTSGRWVMDVNGAQVGAGTQTITSGSNGTVVGFWGNPGTVACGISWNGAAFSTGNVSSLPAITATQFDLGRALTSTTSTLDCDLMWVMGGIGAPSSTDLTALNALGDTTPSFSTVSSAAQPTFIWSASDYYYTVNTAAVGTSQGQQSAPCILVPLGMGVTL